MQLDLPFHAAAPDDVVFVRHRGARRFILRVLPDGTVRVTLPRWGAKRDALAFVRQSRDWIARQLDRRARERAASRAWRHRTPILLDGEPALLSVVPSAGGFLVTCGGAAVAGPEGVDPRDVRPLVERWLRARAARELPAALLALAEAHGLGVAGVSVRNQQSRWGACSRRGRITLNWRLVQAPLFVREYVLLHELMHLKELNHSRRFWRLVAGVCPRFQEARRWLLDQGRELF